MSSMPTKRGVILVLVWPSRVRDHKVVKAVSHSTASFQLRDSVGSVIQHSLIILLNNR